MFGLKIVKSTDYSFLENELEQTRMKLNEKESEIKLLNSTISQLKLEISGLKKLTKSDVQLLTDVAEVPLESEKNIRKVVKKSNTTTKRKTVSRKSE